MPKTSRSPASKEALAMRVTGLTYGEIAKRLNVSSSWVYYRTRPSRYVSASVIAKANQHCSKCRRFTGDGHVHHLKITEISIDDYNDLLNLQYLCSSCHRKAHKGPKTWIRVFRLKEDERKILTRLAVKLDLSQRQVVSRALRELDESVKKNG